MTARTNPFSRGECRAQRGSVLIIVIWVCLGLVALAVYYADQMSSELRAADNRAAEISAREAVAGGTRYATYILSQFAKNGAVPYREDYKAEQLPIGDATVWFIGRDNDQKATEDPVFGLIDEASKINVNTAPRSMLEALPGMTPEFVDAIIAWRSRNGGASADNYSRMDPPRQNKSAPFETVDELRLVYGATLEILLGEDINRNGAIDDNENDGDTSAPHDNSDGLLQPGVLEYLTVYTREPNTRANGSRRINVSTAAQREPQLRSTLQRLFNSARAQAIENRLGSQEVRSVAEFSQRAGLNSQEFAQLRGEITTSNASTIQGLINVNTASETVLACIPGIGPDNAATIAAYRAAHPDVAQGSLAWLTQLLPSSSILRAGPYITDKSYQFSVDVAAVGNLAGRGYCREKTVFDMRTGKPRIIFHQDLTAYGWAIGAQARQDLRDGTITRS